MFLSLVILLAGAVMLCLGLKPRYRGDAPFCAACGYALVGTAAPVCPECGNDVSDPSGVRRGERRRRLWIAAIGACVLMLGFLSGGAAVAHIDWYSLMPEWMLLRTMQSSGPAADRAWSEIESRLKSGCFSLSGQDQLVEIGLREQDRVRPPQWEDGVLKVVGQRLIQGKLTSEQQQLFLRHGMVVSMSPSSLTLRNKWGRCTVNVECRLPTYMLYVRTHYEFDVDEGTFKSPLESGGSLERITVFDPGSPMGGPADVRNPPAGSHVLRIRVFQDVFSAVGVSGPDYTKPLGTLMTDLALPYTLPEHSEPVEP